MKQVLQHLRTGLLEIADLPTPKVSRGHVLIQTQASVISSGTEKMFLEFGQANLWQKARQQPDKVKQVLEKLQTDGIIPTVEAVYRKLDNPMPLGYSNAGIVLEVGADVRGFQVGDRVASNGHHAEIISVPQHLCAKIPDKVTDAQAAFTTLGSIALQGIRLSMPQFGETYMVIGAGLLGLLTIQLLQANGCHVLAVDLNEERLAIAESLGAKVVHVQKGQDPIAIAHQITGGHGVDGVLITASSSSNEIVHQAAEACRKRGSIVLVGVVGLNLRRSDFYEKELSFQVSCSYGPGRYDPTYEQQSQDYPYGFVRWTEQRNFQAVLQAFEAGRLDIEPLLTHRYPISSAVNAYDTIQEDRSALGVLLEYPKEVKQERIRTFSSSRSQGGSEPRFGVIGAGQFAMSSMLPNLKAISAQIEMIADLNAVAAHHAARKFGAMAACTDYQDILDNPGIDAVSIAVGHHLHAKLICEALEAGKHVFVEKPLAIDERELEKVVETAQRHPQLHLMVGFNRRFSPHIKEIKRLLKRRSEPICLQMTINAGKIPADHWTQDPKRGGGRIVGEGCHFLDLLTYLTDSPIISVSSMMLGEGPEIREDKMTISCQMGDGSVGTIHYFANGSKNFPKENLELFWENSVIRMENYRLTRGYGLRAFKKFRTIRQDKGHRSALKAFMDLLQNGGSALIPLDQLANVTHASFAAVQSAKEERILRLPSLQTNDSYASFDGFLSETPAPRLTVV